MTPAERERKSIVDKLVDGSEDFTATAGVAPLNEDDGIAAYPRISGKTTIYIQQSSNQTSETLFQDVIRIICELLSYFRIGGSRSDVVLFLKFGLS